MDASRYTPSELRDMRARYANHLTACRIELVSKQVELGFTAFPPEGDDGRFNWDALVRRVAWLMEEIARDERIYFALSDALDVVEE